MSANVDIAAIVARLANRPADSHKGDYGRALLVGGSTGMAGAIALAGKAALRGGAGLVTLAVPGACLATVAAFDPCYMTVPLAEDSEGRIALAAQARLIGLLESATVLASGPGLSQSDGLTELVGWLYRDASQPAVFDADGLNALARQIGHLPPPAGPRILTPHPGEFARLIGRTIEDRTEQQRAAESFAAQHGIVLLLKGHRTIITDGRRTAINETGNPGMATGGMGDVLTGLITALLGQGLAPFDAAAVAAHLQGMAGDLAAANVGHPSLIATDVIEHLPAAIRAAAS